MQLQNATGGHTNAALLLSYLSRMLPLRRDAAFQSLFSQKTTCRRMCGCCLAPPCFDVAGAKSAEATTTAVKAVMHASLTLVKQSHTSLNDALLPPGRTVLAGCATCHSH
eukprot:6290-Heterococcus_DN1.PRE.8